MSAHPHRVHGSLCAGAACIFFFLAGQAFLPHLGIQNDEALFASVLYQPRAAAFMLHIGHPSIPLMLMSYLGTLKAWIYSPIFRVFGTGVSALREPVLLAGVASVWLFYLLLRRVAGERAASLDAVCWPWIRCICSPPASTGGRWRCSICCWWQDCSS
jgi:4-amino-4-deoxy-L-arabinose transferase-like glycosyltransferase